MPTMSLIKKIKKRLSFDKPYALSWEGWENWRNEHKTNFPIKYFMLEEVPQYFSDKKMFIDEYIWKFKHRYIPKHQYNVIRIKDLEPGYYDPDVLILHSNFQLLTEWYHNNIFDMEHSPNKEMFDIAKELVDWWENVRPNRTSQLRETPEPPKDYPACWLLMDKYKETPIYRETIEIINRNNKIEEYWDQEDQEQLIKLMKIRTILWY